MPLGLSQNDVQRLHAFSRKPQSLRVTTIVRQKCLTTSYMNKAARP